MSEEYKEAVSGEVVKFEKEGDFLEGKYQGHEESKRYKDSYAITLDTVHGIKVVFTSSIVTDLIVKNNIQHNQQIKIVFQGKKPTKDGTTEYNDYKLFYK